MVSSVGAGVKKRREAPSVNPYSSFHNRSRANNRRRAAPETSATQHPPEEEMEMGPDSRRRLRCLEILCVVLLPPLGVYLRRGCHSMRFCTSVLRTILGYFVSLLFVIEAPLMGCLYDYLALLGAFVLHYHSNKGYLHNLLAFLGVFALLGYHPNKDYLQSFLGAVCVFALFVHYPSNGDNEDVDEEDDPATGASYVSLA